MTVVVLPDGLTPPAKAAMAKLGEVAASILCGMLLIIFLLGCMCFICHGIFLQTYRGSGELPALYDWGSNLEEGYEVLEEGQE